MSLTDDFIVVVDENKREFIDWICWSCLAAVSKGAASVDVERVRLMGPVGRGLIGGTTGVDELTDWFATCAVAVWEDDDGGGGGTGSGVVEGATGVGIDVDTDGLWEIGDDALTGVFDRIIGTVVGCWIAIC